MNDECARTWREIKKLLTNPDRPMIAASNLILLALNTIETLDRQRETKQRLVHLKNRQKSVKRPK